MIIKTSDIVLPDFENRILQNFYINQKEYDYIYKLYAIFDNCISKEIELSSTYLECIKNLSFSLDEKNIFPFPVILLKSFNIISKIFKCYSKNQNEFNSCYSLIYIKVEDRDYSYKYKHNNSYNILLLEQKRYKELQKYYNSNPVDYWAKIIEIYSNRTYVGGQNYDKIYNPNIFSKLNLSLKEQLTLSENYKQTEDKDNNIQKELIITLLTANFIKPNILNQIKGILKI